MSNINLRESLLPFHVFINRDKECAYNELNMSWARLIKHIMTTNDVFCV